MRLHCHLPQLPSRLLFPLCLPISGKCVSIPSCTPPHIYTCMHIKTRTPTHTTIPTANLMSCLILFTNVPTPLTFLFYPLAIFYSPSEVPSSCFDLFILQFFLQCIQTYKITPQSFQHFNKILVRFASDFELLGLEILSSLPKNSLTDKSYLPVRLPSSFDSV